MFVLFYFCEANLTETETTTTTTATKMDMDWWMSVNSFILFGFYQLILSIFFSFVRDTWFIRVLFHDFHCFCFLFCSQCMCVLICLLVEFITSSPLNFWILCFILSFSFCYTNEIDNWVNVLCIVIVKLYVCT